MVNLQVEGDNDPAAFHYADDDEPQDFPPFHSFHIPRPPPVPGAQTRPQPDPSQRRPTPSMNGGLGQDPFGFPPSQPSRTTSSGITSPLPSPPPNPMFMDGYRNILEQLLGRLDQQGLQQQQPQPQPQPYPYPYPNPHYPAFAPQQSGHQQFPHQPPPLYGSPSSRIGSPNPYPMPGRPLAATPMNQPQPQPYPPQPHPNPTRRFHYSATVLGPDGQIRTYTSSSDRSDSPFLGSPNGQVAVPTLSDFLGMHNANARFGQPPGTNPQDPLGGNVGMMLRNILESVTPIHGDRGDYLPFVFSG